MAFGRQFGRFLDRVTFRLTQGPQHLARALREASFRSPLYMMTLRGRLPQTVSRPLENPWFGEPADPGSLLSGFLVAAGRRVPFLPDTWSKWCRASRWTNTSQSTLRSPWA